MAIGKTVFLRCENSVDNGWMIITKRVVSLSAPSVKIKNGLTAFGLEAVFEVATAGGLVNFFSSPDALSLTDIWSHEQQLGQAGKYDKQNLYYSRVCQENSIDIQLQQQIISVMKSDDGGPTFWHVMQRSLRGAATAKMIKAQKIINETKLTNVPGLDVGKFHEMVKACPVCVQQAGQVTAGCRPYSHQESPGFTWVPRMSRLMQR